KFPFTEAVCAWPQPDRPQQSAYWRPFSLPPRMQYQQLSLEPFNPETKMTRAVIRRVSDGLTFAVAKGSQHVSAAHEYMVSHDFLLVCSWSGPGKTEPPG